MGNCMETCNRRSQEKQMHENQHDQQEEDDQISLREKDHPINSGFVKESGFGEKGNLRVKIVMTKEELEWLMSQLNNKEGKSLEDVLGEIQRGRAKVEATWKPSLERILECPEVVEMDR